MPSLAARSVPIRSRSRWVRCGRSRSYSHSPRSSPGNGPVRPSARRTALILRFCTELWRFALVFTSICTGPSSVNAVMSPIRRQLVRSCMSANWPSSLRACSTRARSAASPSFPAIIPGDWLRASAVMYWRSKPNTRQASASPTQRSCRATRSQMSSSSCQVDSREGSSADCGSGAPTCGDFPLAIRLTARLKAWWSSSTART